MMDTQTIESRFEDALASPEPRKRLVRVMGELLESGAERPELVEAIERLRARLAADGRLADAELVLELLDGFEGWCRI